MNIGNLSIVDVYEIIGKLVIEMHQRNKDFSSLVNTLNEKISLLSAENTKLKVGHTNGESV